MDFSNKPFIPQDRDINEKVKYSKFKLDTAEGVLAEYQNGRIVGFWKMVAKVTGSIEVGLGDMIFPKMKLDVNTVDPKFGSLDSVNNDYNKKFYSRDTGRFPGYQAAFSYNHGYLLAVTYLYEGKKFDISDFMYYRVSDGRIISEDRWKNEVHCKERYEANSDSTLPRTKSKAEDAGFVRISRVGAKYHGGDDGNLKYVHENGKEAIYRNKDKTKYISNNTYHNNDGISGIDGSGPYGSRPDEAYERITLKDYPQIGPTFNYAYSTGLGEKYTAHYYFDMLPYYKWGTLIPN